MRLLGTLPIYRRNRLLNLFPWLEELIKLAEKEEQLVVILEVVLKSLKKLPSLLLLLSLLWQAPSMVLAANLITPFSLKTEYINNPLGIDVISPRISWELQSSIRSQSQKAFQILVASTSENLALNKGDMWDSGKVLSDETIGIVYNGSDLSSGKRYYWKVRVWDQADIPSAWSTEAAWFEMGLLNSEDWQGLWIGWDRGNIDTFNMDGVSWIWYPEGNPRNIAPAGTRYFRKTISIPSNKQIRQVIFAGLADDVLHIYINGQEAARGVWDEPVLRVRNELHKGFRFIDLTDLMRSGTNAIAMQATNSSESPAGLIGKLRITYTDGTLSFLQTDSTWKTSNLLQNGWEQPGFNDSGWQNTMEIARHGDLPWGALFLPSLKVPAPILRKEFTISKEVSSARIYLCGLGYYDFRMNGQKVGDRVLDTAFTNFNKRVLYTTYDVTSLLQQGLNAIGVELGRGFYGLKVGNDWGWENTSWNSEPKMILQLNIQFTDGTSTTISSDTSWKANAGPTISDAVYLGDDYDARREKVGWDSPGYSDSGWFNATAMTAPSGQLRAQMMPPIMVIETIRPVSVTSPKPNLFVFDMGKITAGWAGLTASAPAGTMIKIKYGEKLNSENPRTVNADNDKIYEPNFQIDSYIFKGEGIETWEPKFSYKGFQYIEVSGFPGTLTLDSILGKVIHSAVETVGNFYSSNQLFNKIHTNSVNSMLNNYHSIPTDTPMFEKNGWLGDAHLSSEAAMYNFGMHAFYTKWLNDIRDSQADNGLVPWISPSESWGYWDAPEWAAAYPIILWNIYQYYGDKRILEEHYSDLKKYIEYEIANLDGNSTSDSRLGDWLPPGRQDLPPERPKISATGYVYHDLQVMSQIAGILGKSGDASSYMSISTNVKNGLNNNHLDVSKNQYFTEKTDDFRQTNTLLPTTFGMVPDDMRAGLLTKLVEDINSKGIHLDTGILGTKYIFSVLSDYGYGETAYTIADQTTYPGYGYLIILKGATSNWESWESDARSRDHHMFGSIDEWFYKYLVGIKSASPGFKTITIKPYLLGDLKNASGQINTVRGVVSASWSKGPNNNFVLSVTIPTNTTAAVYVPAKDSTMISESGIPAENSPGVKYLRMENGYAVYLVASGSYFFTSVLNQTLPYNIARGAAFTSSSTINNGEWDITKVNDGIRDSVSSSKGWTSNNLTPINHPESIQLDMGSPKTFNQVDLYPRNDGENKGHGFPVDFTIEVSDDGSDWTTVMNRTDYPFPTEGKVQSFMFSIRTARYIRVQGTNLRSNPYDFSLYRMQFAEIEVFDITTPTHVIGDIDDNGSINLSDVILALQIISGMHPERIRKDYNTSGVDINNDSKIGMEEVIYILQKIGGFRP